MGDIMQMESIKNFFCRIREVIAVKDETYGLVDSVDFAIYLNQKAREMKLDVNVTKIQKWLYICYGLFLAAKKEQLLTERPKAWQFGPVFPRVYKKQQKNGNHLDSLMMSVDVEELRQYDEFVSPVLDHFGKWSAAGLVEWTHEKGGAWDRKYNHGGKQEAMDNFDIMKDFLRFVKHEH